MFWGLHFSPLRNAETIRTNREFVLKGLVRSTAIWKHWRDAGEGAKDLLEARVSDTLWMLNNVRLISEIKEFELKGCPLGEKANLLSR